jgi:putative hemolysin
MLAGTAAQVQAGTAVAPASATTNAGSSYCAQTGGVLQMRQAVYGTNNPPADWVPLATTEEFCVYKAADTSTINLSVATLQATKPTLAALAYYAQVPWNGVGNGNPASFYCTQLGGAEIGATSFSGGAWVATSNPDRELETCVFPDNSTIDSWGLLYHANNIIRGIDLTTVLKFPNPYVTK